MILGSDILLKNKVILVTGCNRGIGRGIVLQFIKSGATVYANARKEGSLLDLEREIDAKERFIPLYFDVTDSIAVKQAFMQIYKKHKRLDCLVNNAGIMKDALLGMITKSMMQEIFETNVFATIELLQYAAKFMVKNNAGSIINMASLVGVNGNAGQISYSATKGAIISITKSAAKELAAKNIRVNAIAPGIIDTDLLSNVNENTLISIKERIRMGRMGTPEDIANVAVFLASDLSNYVTGQIIGVDGSTLM